MIPIDNSEGRLDILRQQYLEQVKLYFKISSAPLEKNKLEKVFYRKKSLEYRMIRHFCINLDKIILTKPDQLLKVHDQFINELKISSTDQQHQKQLSLFRMRMENYYSGFFSKSIRYAGKKTAIGRWLSEMINMKVCPYCNHNYTLTVSDHKDNINFRPDFDHFYPKSLYPLLALSFYNLIPSCTVCNKLKGNHLVRYSPYSHHKNMMSFKLYGVDKDEEPVLLGLGDKPNKIIIKPVYLQESIQSACNLKTFGIEKVYEHQVDYVQEIIARTQCYNQDFFIEMVENYKGLGKTEAEIDRIIWSAYLDDHSKRPLSKLTNDLLIQLGIKDF